MSNCIISRNTSLYKVGDIFITTDSTNPSIRFGGTWELIGDCIPISNHVFGNGTTLGLTEGTNLFSIVKQANGGFPTYQVSYKSFGGELGQVGSHVGYVPNNELGIGVPTKSQLGTTLANSGLIIDSITCNIWKKTA